MLSVASFIVMLSGAFLTVILDVAMVNAIAKCSTFIAMLKVIKLSVMAPKM